MWASQNVTLVVAWVGVSDYCTASDRCGYGKIRAAVVFAFGRCRTEPSNGGAAVSV